jgi:predicted amino acid-binding ACT domain protein
MGRDVCGVVSEVSGVVWGYDIYIHNICGLSMEKHTIWINFSNTTLAVH